jgi:AcrR family transcriptional regulator
VKRSLNPRQRLFEAAQKTFANCGYAAASVQDIVDLARVTKPTLYYYFGSKEGLYQAMVDYAQDERYQLMQKAAAQYEDFEDQLVAVLEVLFRFAREHQELTRICFASAFAAPGEIPQQDRFFSKGFRNFEFVHSLVKNALTTKMLKTQFRSHEITAAIYGQILMHTMSQAVRTKRPKILNGDARRCVMLLLAGVGKVNAK